MGSKGMGAWSGESVRSRGHCLLGALKEGVVFGLLGAEAYGGDQLDFPTAGGAIQKKQVCTCGFAVVEIGGPVTVRVGFGASQRVVGAEDQAEVLGADQVFGDPMVREPELLARIVHVAS
jgi:hypothetical protein